MLKLVREEINQKPGEWIFDKEMYPKALEFSRSERQLSYFLKQVMPDLEKQKQKTSPAKPLLLYVLYNSLAKNELPEDLKFRMPQWQGLK